MTLREQVAQAICSAKAWGNPDDMADAALAVVRQELERVAAGLHFQPMHGNVNTEAVRVWAFGMLAAAFDVG